MKTKSNYLIVIAGPTAVGKTATAIQIAEHFKASILSADSRQVYKEMSIGTAVPSLEELMAVPHHFIQHRSIFQPYDVATYEKEVIQFLEEYYKKHSIAVLCGGTGLYIDAVCHGLDSFPEISTQTKDRVKKMEEEGIETLQQALKETDFDYYQKVDLANPRRLCRALEVIIETGRPYSSFTSESKIKATRFFKTIKIFLQTNRNELYERIDKRVDVMMAQGLLEEATALYPHKTLKALDTVGYKELFDYFDHACSLQEAIQKIKQHSRNYAKRQITWFKKDKSYLCFHPDELESIIRSIEQQLCLET